MFRIFFEKIEVSSDHSLHCFWKARFGSPESSCCTMLHRSLRAFFAFAASAARTRETNAPVSASASIFLSHLSQSFSDSHLTSSANSALDICSISILGSSTFDRFFPPSSASERRLNGLRRGNRPTLAAQYATLPYQVLTFRCAVTG